MATGRSLRSRNRNKAYPLTSDAAPNSTFKFITGNRFVLSAVPSGSYNRRSRKRHYIMEDTNGDIYLYFTNSYMSNVSSMANGADTITLNCTVEYNRTIYPVTFSGASSKVLTPGQGVWGKVVGLTSLIKASYLYTNVWSLGSNTGSVNRIRGIDAQARFDEGAAVSANTTDNEINSYGIGATATATVMGGMITAVTFNNTSANGLYTGGDTLIAYQTQADGTILQRTIGTYTVSGGNPTLATITDINTDWVAPSIQVCSRMASFGSVSADVYAPIAIVSKPIDVTAKQILLVGDSIPRASADITQSATGAKGIYERVFNDRYAYANISFSGRKASDLSAPASSGLSTLFDLLSPYFSDVLIALGGNDAATDSAATIKANLNSHAAYWRAKGKRVIFSTIPPRTTGTFTSAGGQTPTTGFAASGVVDTVNADLMSNTVLSDSLLFDLRGATQDPASVNVWRSDGGVAYTDGTHLTQFGMIDVVNDITFDLSPVAAPLPASTSALGNTLGGLREDVTNVAMPAGDWSVGGWFRIESSATNHTGAIFNLYPAAGSYGLYLNIHRDTGSLRFGGTDSSGNTIGSYSERETIGSLQESVLASFVYQYGTDVFVVCQKVGDKAQIWIKPNGHAAFLAGEEKTLYGATTSQTFRFGRARSDLLPTDAKMRNWFKLSYSLTKTQIDEIGNGADPTTYGSYAADDFYIPMGVSGTTWTSTINGKSTTWGGGTTSTVSGIGYSVPTNAVHIDPVGQDGFVFQQEGGSATVNLTGLYHGAGGGNIQVQLLNESNAAFQGWQTVASGISGGTWSGSLTVPKGKRWIKIQARKTTSATEITTTTIRFGVGENIVLMGQSLMDYMRNTSNPYGTTTGNTLNGYVSFQDSLKVLESGTFTERLNITGAANSGGLIEITTTNKHGRRTGDKVVISNITGTTEANDRVWTVTVTATNKFTLDGSTFTNAYVSGGYAYVGKHIWRIPNQSYLTISGGHAIIANQISNSANCVVCLANRAVSGTAISSHYSWTGGTAPYTLLTGHAMKKIGAASWAQGHNDLGLSPIRQYFADAGTGLGSWTGWGLLGTLYDYYKTNWPNNSFRFGVFPFNTVTGNVGYAASIYQDFKFGMKDWCDRKIANGETNVYVMGWGHDLQPQLESNGIGAHLCPEYKGALSMAARIGHDVGVKLAGSGNTSFGPQITAATRSGANIDLTISHNGGSSLQIPTVGARPSGFQVSTSTTFASYLAISSVSILSATSVRITLAADPGATCYVRYMYGYISDLTAVGKITPLVTGVADNGSGLIRITTDTAAGSTIPSSYQRTGGHGLTTGQWVRISGVKGATQANGYWQVTVISATMFDLVGSSSAGLGTFATGNLWNSGGSAVVETDVSIPIYDNRTIGGVDTLGAPLQPTYSYFTAT